MWWNHSKPQTGVQKGNIFISHNHFLTQQEYSWELILKREKFLKEKLYVQNILCNAMQSIKHWK